ncbi:MULTISPECIES: YtpI family protein [Pontibacillus]|uniref:YtpI family protein n=1 Tax=Pontibacillus chungwhensis TaxID=265426 RepID=A0ABY8UV78_9BACI|nr:MULTISPECIES: YtpI family protein [Pontibacillus]MCD5323847.1 YtpI family protein [Pontibacillus sp. HN14]WIF97208.1 YtpI family protein [Pontibacillus chungwhensis]
MVIIPIIIVLSLAMYLFYKVQILRLGEDPLKQVYTNSKARMALGLFMLSISINVYLVYQTRLALYITILFIALGGAQLVYGYKTTRFYGKQLKERSA